MSTKRFKVRLTYEITVESDSITDAIARAKGRIEPSSSSYGYQSSSRDHTVIACEAVRLGGEE